MSGNSCVILCSAYPYSATGTACAVRSLLPVVVELFDRVDYVAVAAEDRSASEAGAWAESVDFRYVPANAGPKWKRFAKSLFSKWPATTQRYVVPGLLETLHRCSRDGRGKPVLIVLDTPLYWTVLADPSLHENYAAVILWSHNVMSEAFDGVLDEVSGLRRLSWLWEIKRLRRYEKAALSDADAVWAITEHDGDRYKEVFGFSVDGVLGVILDSWRFEAPVGGPRDSILYLGSFDIRKSFGIGKFVTQVFPRVREAHPESTLWLGGKGSENFDATSPGVHGIGFVDDEAEFLERGLVFVNPQESGSGLKLKSLHALAAGKVLLTTPVGAQGIPGTVGRDFFVAERVEDMEAQLGRIFSEEVDLEAVAENGRALARKYYGEKEQTRKARELFSRILSPVDERSANPVR